jgi:hypothetical protein
MEPLPKLSEMFGNIKDAYTTGIDDILKPYFDAGGPDQIERKNVKNNVTNIGKVEIRQDFKENQEPDRIAESVVRALGRVAKNPTQSAGRSMQGALNGAN